MLNVRVTIPFYKTEKNKIDTETYEVESRYKKTSILIVNIHFGNNRLCRFRVVLVRGTLLKTIQKEVIQTSFLDYSLTYNEIVNSIYCFV